MKRILLILVIISVCICKDAMSQLSAVSYKSDEFAQFRASKTYIIKTGVAEFDDAVLKAMEDNWTITKFSTTTVDELKTLITDESASFMGVILIGEPNRGYHYLALFNGGKKKLNHYKYDDMIAYAPVNRWVDEPELTDCHWRVPNMIESMISAIQIVQDQDIKGNTLKIVQGLRDHYNARAKDIPNRTLLVSEQSMGRKFKKAEFLSEYPYKVEVCEREKVENAIKEKSTEYYYLQPGITLNKSYFVFDPSNGDVMFFDYDVQGMEINKKNVRKLVEAIKE